MKLMVSALAAVLAAATAAQAAPITGEQLTGTTSGGATVFQVDLSTTGLSQLSGLTITDSGNAALNGSNSLASGLDIDAIWISTVDCSSVSCLASATSAADFDYTGAVFSAGGLLNGGTGDLYGTSGGALLPGVATLGALDAQLSPTVNGFFSTGLNGSLTLNLLTALNLLTGNYYLYIAEVGGGGAEFSFNLLTLDEGDMRVTPIPAALPLMLTGLASVGFFGRRNRKKKTA